MTATVTGRTGFSNLHEASASERNDQHEGPVGEEAEKPHNVAKWSGQAKLNGLAVKGVEPRIEENKALLVSGLVQLDNVVRGDGGKVQPGLVDIDGGGLGKHLDSPDVARVGRPSVAKDGLVVTVDKAHMGSIWELGKLGRRLVEGSLNSAAVTEACLVTAAEQNIPLLRRLGAGCHRLVERLLPVIQAQDRQLHRTRLGLVSASGIVCAGKRQLRADLSQNLLELGHILIQRILLGGGEGGQSRDKSGCREAHGGAYCWGMRGGRENRRDETRITEDGGGREQ